MDPFQVTRRIQILHLEGSNVNCTTVVPHFTHMKAGDFLLCVYKHLYIQYNKIAASINPKL
jgi:hypothetical protein